MCARCWLWRQGAVDAGHNRPICHLKIGKKRSELYAKVWAQPISRLAKELGISDVGLPRPAAVTRCPPHRAAIGPSSMRARRRFEPLPTPELDVVVHFATSDPQEREPTKAHGAQAHRSVECIGHRRGDSRCRGLLRRPRRPAPVGQINPTVLRPDSEVDRAARASRQRRLAPDEGGRLFAERQPRPIQLSSSRADGRQGLPGPNGLGAALFTPRSSGAWWPQAW